MLFNLALRNVMRNKRRSILTALGIIIAVALLIYSQGFISGMIGNMIENTARIKTGHIRIVTHEFERRKSLYPLGEALYITPELERMIENTPQVRAFTYRIPFGVLLSNGNISKPAFGNAIDVEREKGFLDLSTGKYLKEGSYLAPNDKGILIGKGLAEDLGFKVGDSLVVITSDAYGSPSGINLTVKGIIELGQPNLDEKVFYVPLAAAQELLGLQGRAAEALVLLDSRENADRVAAKWQKDAGETLGLDFIPWKNDDFLGMMSMVFKVFWVIYFVILLIASATIINTMLMAVFERIKEIGILKAMGMRSSSILWLLTVEASMIGFFGAVVGTVFGLLLALAAPVVNFSSLAGQDLGTIYFDPIIRLDLSAAAVVGCFLFGWFVATLTALYPARQGTKVEPASALRRI